MDRALQTHKDRIANATWMVRYYGLQRNASQRLRRKQAIQLLGLILREAFAEADDFEPILTALLDGLNTKESIF